MKINSTQRLGIIADSKLLQHTVAAAVRERGYTVAINVHPAKLESVLSDNTRLSIDSNGMATVPNSDLGVDAWLVELEQEDVMPAHLYELIADTDKPVLFGDGNPPGLASEHYPRWRERLFQKLAVEIGEPQELVQGTQAAPVLTDVVGGPERLDFKRPGMQAIWVLGSSLGGPDAVKTFLDSLPEKIPLAFVLAQHIDKGFHETLIQVLGKDNNFNFVAMNVKSSRHQLKAGDILICDPVQKVLVSPAGSVSVAEQTWRGSYAPSIDETLEQVASVCGSSSGAIIFTGMGDDGVIGAQQMVQQGGTVWAQSAVSCADSSMPNAVRAADCVTYSGSPQELAQHLASHYAG